MLGLGPPNDSSALKRRTAWAQSQALEEDYHRVCSLWRVRIFRFGNPTRFFGTSPVEKKICAGSEPPCRTELAQARRYFAQRIAVQVECLQTNTESKTTNLCTVTDSIGMKQRNFQAAHRRTAV